MGAGQSSFDRAAKGTLIPVALEQFKCPVGAIMPAPNGLRKANLTRHIWEAEPTFSQTVYSVLSFQRREKPPFVR